MHACDCGSVAARHDPKMTLFETAQHYPLHVTSNYMGARGVITWCQVFQVCFLQAGFAN